MGEDTEKRLERLEGIVEELEAIAMTFAMHTHSENDFKKSVDFYVALFPPGYMRGMKRFVDRINESDSTLCTECDPPNTGSKMSVEWPSATKIKEIAAKSRPSGRELSEGRIKKIAKDYINILLLHPPPD